MTAWWTRRCWRLPASNASAVNPPRQPCSRSTHSCRQSARGPALNRCEVCRKPENDHANEKHKYKRDARFPEWHGWHAARRGLGSNLYRLGVPDMVIQRILRLDAKAARTCKDFFQTAGQNSFEQNCRLATEALTVGSLAVLARQK